MLKIDHCRLVWPDFSADYSLDVPEGALCALVGPSGGGKTTLLHMIAGFETPQAGALTFRAADLLGLEPAQRPVALVFQDHNLFPHLSAFENAGLGLRPSLRLGPEEAARVRKALEDVGLGGLEDRKPAQMSGGQRQRVALARALVSQKPLVLLDEPFSSLDPALRREMIELVGRLRRERPVTILMSIHTPEEAAGIADMMALVRQGRVVASGRPDEILPLLAGQERT